MTHRQLPLFEGALVLDVYPEDSIWRPYLPEPQPAFVFEPGEPDPVPLAVLREARRLCSEFRVPPRQFRRRTTHGIKGFYYPRTDIVAVDPVRAALEALGGEDGYYATLLHELLHATERRLGRRTVGDFSPEGDALEEGTVYEAQRLVLRDIGFDAEAIRWHAPEYELPIDREAAARAASS